jgi:L-threonylcarbamoyladenylate synthase
MKIFKMSGNGVDSEAVKDAVRVLAAGGVVMHPTETCYGLAANIYNKDALAKLHAIKKMSDDKPVSMMVTSLEDAREFADFDDLPKRLAEKFWPGPLTLILKRKDSLAAFFNEKEDAVGIRCPDSEISRALIREFGRPLTTTSANVSGQKEVYKVEDFLAQYGEGDLLPDLILDGGEMPKNMPSTIVSFGGEKPMIIREGILAAEVKAFLTI